MSERITSPTLIPPISEQLKHVFGSEILIPKRTTPYYQVTHILSGEQEVTTIAFPIGLKERHHIPPILPYPEDTPTFIDLLVEYNSTTIGSAFHFLLARKSITENNLQEIQENPHFQQVGSIKLHSSGEESIIQEISHFPDNEAILETLATLFPNNPPPSIPRGTQPYYLTPTKSLENKDLKSRVPFTIAFPSGGIHTLELPPGTPDIIIDHYHASRKTIFLQPSSHHPPTLLQVIEVEDNKKAGQIAIAAKNCRELSFIGDIFTKKGVRLVTHRICQYDMQDPKINDDAIIPLCQKKSPHQNQSNNFQRLLSNK